jgi:putative transposase
MKSIINKICRKKKGSKAFWRAKEHQKNYINWSLKQLNLSNIKEIRVEKISNFRHKKNVGKFLNQFGEKLIRSKLIDVAQQCGVRIVEQQSAYRSQRCSKCGYVDRKNRSGKNFSCKHCSFQIDADLNASLNHEINLPSSENIRLLVKNKNIKFFWKEEGFYDLQGQELTVPAT